MIGEPEVHTGELARVLRLYAGPPEPRPLQGRAGSTRVPGRAVLATVGLAVAGVATAAVLSLERGGGDRTHAALAPTGCSTALIVDGNRYVERALAARLKPGRSLGGGVLRPCAAASADVTAVALVGIDARRAVGVRGVQTRIYVAQPCSRTAAARLLRCLRSTR